MNPINGGPGQSYQTPSPYAPFGKPAVGLESPENKDQTLPPVEETSASEKNRNHPNQKADAVSGDAHGDHGKNDQQSVELTDEEQQAHELANDSDTHAHEAGQFIVQTPIEIALQRAALQGDHSKGVIDTHTAVDRFSAAAGHTPTPGSLFDQRS